MNPDPSLAEQPAAEWRPLSAFQRRVIGVMIEKAKTTPDAYPLTLKALATGCNQKSNRSPQMNLSEDDIQQALDEMRGMGAVAEVQSGGRVPKYRHYMYEWLGVDKVELAIMAELLLRGEQTLGELRGRAARMDTIADVNALRSHIDTLIEKQLVVALTPAGRGQLVTHNLYSEEAMQRLKQRIATARPVASSPRPSAAASSKVSLDDFNTLKLEVERLRDEFEQLKTRLESP